MTYEDMTAAVSAAWRSADHKATIAGHGLVMAVESRRPAIYRRFADAIALESRADWLEGRQIARERDRLFPQTAIAHVPWWDA